jgi:hypothetical protein
VALVLRLGMATRNMRFVAVETIKKPILLKFKTKSGNTVFFKAVKTVEKKK